MSSLFDMNVTKRLCPVCSEIHPPTNPCKYDVLVRNIHTMKHSVMSMMKANREAVGTAKAFQQIIRDMTPEMERLAAVEMEYRALVNGLKDSATFAFAPSTDPNKPVPLVGVSADRINELLPPVLMDEREMFNKWIMEKYKDHFVSQEIANDLDEVSGKNAKS